MPRVPFTIYSHADTDGAIAALLLQAQLTKCYGDQLTFVIEPVHHGATHGAAWASRALHVPFAVLDFTLHPSMMLPRTYETMRSLPESFAGMCCYWLDHHATGANFPFLTESNVSDFLPDNLKAVWDTSAKSTPGLIRKHRHALGFSEEILKQYEYLIDWAEIIDGALFESAVSALNGSDPIVQFDYLFSSKHPALQQTAFYRNLIRDLLEIGSQFPLVILDRDPLYRAVIDYEMRLGVKKRRAYEGILEEKNGGRIAVCDFRRNPSLWCGLSRFEPYSLSPSCQYAIHISPPDLRNETCSITCGQNPWNPPSSLPSLGDYFAEHFGGGGHRFVAGGVLSAQDQQSIDRLLSFLQE